MKRNKRVIVWYQPFCFMAQNLSMLDVNTVFTEYWALDGMNALWFCNVIHMISDTETHRIEETSILLYRNDKQ